ncbi:MAG TPA: hypothetical protein VHC43_14065 [Mycobacteriales bacterium]|nr:hypothetical protein [Mycobacteriales bacterium]
MAPRTQTVTETLTAYSGGALSRERMLDAMRTYPWRAVKSSNPDPRFFSESAWEHMDYPQLGTVQEVYSAKASGVISEGDCSAICDVVRSGSRSRGC